MTLADEIARAAVHMARSPQNCIGWGGGFSSLPPTGINCSRAAGNWRWEHPAAWERAISYARGLLDARTPPQTAPLRGVGWPKKGGKAPGRLRTPP